MPFEAPHEAAQPPALATAEGCLLAFDSATEMLAVALQKGARVWTHDGPGGAVASARLIPEIRAWLETAGLAFGDLDGIAFGAGPGAFTGLRTACSVAPGLAFGAGVRVLAIDSLMVVAEAARDEAIAQTGEAPSEVLVAMDARMGEIYAATYRRAASHWQVLVPPALHTPATLQALWCSLRDRPPILVAGSAADAFGDRLDLGGAPRTGAASGRAAALMRVAQQQWRAGVRLPAHEALPLYLRDKVAHTIAERGLLAEAAR
jgi:tRNA threonylcarbamoyladenosine biosynthesis protein TsaB